jgi:hypothetical protein
MNPHSLNAVCPYYTMYPLAFPLGVLQRRGRPGDLVLDPFCGRGTTNFAARILGMPSLGIDSSPVAAALSQAKVTYASPAHVVRSAALILRGAGDARNIPDSPFWRRAYHPRTLASVCKLREALLGECSSASCILLRAILLGALHGPRPKGSASYFSNQAPRTFAPKPRYATRFWKTRGLHPDDVDVLAVIRHRAERYLADRLPDVGAEIRCADSRDSRTFAGVPPPRWIITSPPYYGMRTYLPDQWLRSWFLGGPAHPEYACPASQIEHTGADHFATHLARVWQNLRSCSTARTRLVVRFGGIHDRAAEPMEVLRASLSQGGWRIRTARRVPEAAPARRQVTQFHAVPRASIAEHDVYCEPV